MRGLLPMEFIKIAGLLNWDFQRLMPLHIILILQMNRNSHCQRKLAKRTNLFDFGRVKESNDYGQF